MMNNFNLRKPANTVPMDVMSGIPLQYKLQKFTNRIYVQCKKDGIETISGNPIKIIFHCKLCNVSMCERENYNKYHSSLP